MTVAEDKLMEEVRITLTKRSQRLARMWNEMSMENRRRLARAAYVQAGYSDFEKVNSKQLQRTRNALRRKYKRGTMYDIRNRTTSKMLGGRIKEKLLVRLIGPAGTTAMIIADMLNVLFGYLSEQELASYWGDKNAKDLIAEMNRLVEVGLLDHINTVQERFAASIEQATAIVEGDIVEYHPKGVPVRVLVAPFISLNVKSDIGEIEFYPNIEVEFPTPPLWVKPDIDFINLPYEIVEIDLPKPDYVVEPYIEPPRINQPLPSTEAPLDISFPVPPEILPSAEAFEVPNVLPETAVELHHANDNAGRRNVRKRKKPKIRIRRTRNGKRQQRRRPPGPKYDLKGQSGRAYLSMVNLANKSFGTITEIKDLWDVVTNNWYVRSPFFGREYKGNLGDDWLVPKKRSNLVTIEYFDFFTQSMRRIYIKHDTPIGKLPISAQIPVIWMALQGELDSVIKWEQVALDWLIMEFIDQLTGELTREERRLMRRGGIEGGLWNFGNMSAWLRRMQAYQDWTHQDRDGG
jgi:hypothetical protein